MGPNPQFNTESYAPDRLIAGDAKRTTAIVTLITGENVVRGEVLGKITASGKYNSSLNAAIDGSEVASVICAEPVDATAGDKEVSVYLTGQFDSGEATFGAGQTAANTLDDLRDKNIHWKTSVPA